MAAVKGQTKTGFEFEIDEEVFDDYELLELLKKSDKGDTSAFFDAMDIIFTEEQKDALKEHVRNEKGRVPASAIVAEVMDVMNCCSAGKNS